MAINAERGHFCPMAATELDTSCDTLCLQSVRPDVFHRGPSLRWRLKHLRRSAC